MKRFIEDAALIARLVAQAEKDFPDPKSGNDKRKSVRDAAKAELGLRCLLWVGRAIEVAVATYKLVQDLGPPPGLDK